MDGNLTPILQSHTSTAASVIAEALETARRTVASKAGRVKEAAAEVTKSIDTAKIKPQGEAPRKSCSSLAHTCWVCLRLMMSISSVSFKAVADFIDLFNQKQNVTDADEELVAR